MKFYNTAILILCIIFFGACTSNDEPDYTDPILKITAFNPTKQEVEISWELSKGTDIIIEDLLVFRETIVDDSGRTNFELIESLPSSAKSYIDVDVPYVSNITYVIKANYRPDVESSYDLLTTESDPQVFSRLFPEFNRVPYQVSRDPANENVYHILDNWDMAKLMRYDSQLNRVIQKQDIVESFDYGNRFIFSSNKIVAASRKGKFFFVDKDTYKIDKQYNASLDEKLEGFGIIGDRLYYVEDFSFDYIDLISDVINKHGLGPGFKNFQVLNDKQLLSLYTGPHTSGASVYEFQEDLDPGSGWDFSMRRIKATPTELNLDGDDVDEFTFAWNNDRTQFITGIEGRIFNIDDLSQRAILTATTGKRYFGFIFDNNGDIYASVQKERIIHVFDGETLELKQEIPTKLYPLYPMPTANGLYCIGAYDKLEYWGYDFGYANGFNSRSAVETF